MRSLAIGGQILVSQAAAEMVVDHLPDDVSLVELGEQQLRGLTRPERVRAVVDAARPIREALGGLCPYKGLLAFQPDEDDIFFGREAQVEALLDRLLQHRFVVVVGASGSGKSSLVRAGVLAALRRGDVPGSERWPLRVITPGEHPALRLAEVLTPPEEGGGATGPLVVGVDQMEELFIVCRDPLERERFVDILLDAVADDSRDVLVVCALRADFYGSCASIARLAAAVSDVTFLLGPMVERELRRAIDGPAGVAGLRLEPGLADLVLRDLAHEPGSLPLLSHALLETWRRRSGRTLTINGYRESGGVRGAIATTAEAVWNEALGERERPVARRIFLRLTELGEGTEDTRRRVARTDMASGPDADEVDAVLRLLVDRRLVTADEGTIEVAHEALIREWPRLRTWLDDDREGLRAHRHLTHAAEDWDQLGRDPAELYRGPRLVAAREWLGRDGEAELNERELAFVDASEASEREVLRAEEERVSARERTNRRLRVLLAATAVALVVALVTGSLAVAQRRRADRQADRARATSVAAEVDRAVAEVPTLLDRDRSLALLLAVQAHRIRPGAATAGALLAALVDEPRLQATVSGGRDGYAWLAPFPDGERVAALGRDGVDVWDLGTGQRDGSFDVPPEGSGLAVSPDGSLVAAGSRTGRVGIWDTRTFEAVGSSIDAGEGVADIAFVGRDRLAVAVGRLESDDPVEQANAARIWDVTTGRPAGGALDGHDRTVNALALSPDDRLLAAGDNSGRVVFHDPATGAPIGAAVPVGADEGIYRLAFSPDGRWLGVGTFGGTGLGHAYVVDVAARQVVTEALAEASFMAVGFSGDGSRFVTAGDTIDVFDADGWDRVTTEPIDSQHGARSVLGARGRTFLTGGFDGTLSTWDAEGLPAIARVVDGAPAFGGTYSPNGEHLAVVADDDTVTLYRADGARLVGTVSVGGRGRRGALDGATPIAFAPDSRTFAVGDRSGAVQLFDTATLESAGPPVTVGPTPVVALSFHPDGRSLVATSNSDNVNGAHVLDLGTGRVRALDPPMPYALSAAFRPDGRELVVTAGPGGASRYPVSDGVIGTGEPLTITESLTVSAAFSPDGSRLALGTAEGTLSFFDAETLAPVGTSVSVSPGLLASLAWSPDARLLVVQDIEAENHLIDVGQRRRIGNPFPGAAPMAFGVGGFAPDGRTMVIPGPQGTMTWDLVVDRWSTPACRLAGQELTDLEWRTYFSTSGPDRPACANP